MEHRYFVYRRKGKMFSPVPLDVEAINALLYAGEIEHDQSYHTGTDKSMTHYFKFKDV